MSYRDLLKNKTQTLESIANKFKPPQEFEEDNRFWYPDVDKAGNGLAVIRFLPAPENEDSPFACYYRRSFQGPTGKWYIENCLTSLKDGVDPVNEYSKALLGGKDWKVVSDDIKNTWRKLKRKETYVCNIYVEKDPAHPENEGKVFLFRFGKFIRGLIADKMSPELEGEERINPFDMTEGCSLKLRINKDAGGWRSYKKSEWMAVGPLIKKGKTGEPDHDKQEAIYNSMYPLTPFTAPDQFKSYEVLEAKLNEVMGAGRARAAPAPTSQEAAVDDLISRSEDKEVTETKTLSTDSEIEDLFADLDVD